MRKIFWFVIGFFLCLGLIYILIPISKFLITGVYAKNQASIEFDVTNWDELQPRNYFTRDEIHFNGKDILISTDRFKFGVIGSSSTHSMIPSLSDYSHSIEMIIQENNLNYDYKKGEIACFWNNYYFPSNNIKICHRIIDLSSNKILTLGDSDKKENAIWVNKSDVNSIVIGVIY